MLKSMLTRLRESRVEGEEAAEAGFTLIELMVVLLIIAILLAIAIPTFLGVTGSANDRAAQSNLTNALTELKALYQNGQTYCPAVANCAAGNTPLLLGPGAGTIKSSAPEFTWTAAGSNVSAGNAISIQPIDVQANGDGQGVIIAAFSKTNTCWYAVDLETTPSAITTAGDTVGVAFPVAAQGGSGNAAGVYYSKVVNPAGQTCDANVPVTAASWTWGTTYTNAPLS